ncbi:unnamed protein product [Calypogeia fissa]
MDSKDSARLGDRPELLSPHATAIKPPKSSSLPHSSDLKNDKGESQNPGQASSSRGGGKSVKSEGALDEMEIDVGDGQTSIGQYRVWHPDESVPVAPVGFEEYLLCVEDLVANFRLPYRRVTGRDDGKGGAVLFQPTEKPPPGIEDAIFRAFSQPKRLKAKCEFPDRERWNEILEGDYRKVRLGEKKKRCLSVYTSSGEPQKASTSASTESQPCQEGGVRKKRKEYDRPDPHVDLELAYVKTGTQKNSTFIPLEEWMRNKYVFTLMHKIHFFGNYLRQKCFSIWRKHIGQTHFTRVRKELVGKLFFAKPAFLAALSQIYGHVYQLCELEMLSVVGNHLYNLEEFIHLQDETRQTILAPAVETAADKVQDVLATICLEAKKQAKIYRVCMIKPRVSV